MRFYAGIGSRETPIQIEPVIEEVATFLEKMEYVLRSGAAPGADAMFEKHAKKKEIYLPWTNFNGNLSPLSLEKLDPVMVNEAEKIASKYHPAWQNASDASVLPRE